MREQIEKLDALLKSIEADVNATKGEGANINPTAREIRQALAEALIVSARLMADTTPSPVSYAPCITGKVEVEGAVSEFMIPLEDDSVRYSQWGAGNMALWPRVDLMEGMADAAREWYADNRPEDEEQEDGNA
jgi:hypothetical protein